MALGAATSRCHRLAHVRTDQSALLKAVQRGINCAGCDLPSSGDGDLFTNGRTVGAFVSPHQRHQDDKFQFTKTVAWGHMYYLTVHIDERWRGWLARGYLLPGIWASPVTTARLARMPTVDDRAPSWNEQATGALSVTLFRKSMSA